MRKSHMELSLVKMEGIALAQSCVSTKAAELVQARLDMMIFIIHFSALQIENYKTNNLKIFDNIS